MTKKKKSVYYIIKAVMKDGKQKYLCFNPRKLNYWGEEISCSQKRFSVTTKRSEAEPWDYIPEDLKELRNDCREKGEIEKLIPIEVTEEIKTVIKYKEITT